MRVCAPTAPSARTRRPRRNVVDRALVLKRQHSRDVCPSARTAHGRLIGAPARIRTPVWRGRRLRCTATRLRLPVKLEVTCGG
jgi:hypothetical protein